MFLFLQIFLITLYRCYEYTLEKLESKRQLHWKTKDYEEIKQYLIALKSCKKTQFSVRNSIKQQLRQLAQKTNFGVVEQLIKVFDS